MATNRAEVLTKREALKAALPARFTGQEIVLVIVIAAIWAILSFATPAFLTGSSIRPLLVSVSSIALIGIGMTFVIITAGIDVSIAGILMVSAVVVAKFAVNIGIPFWLAVLIAIVTGGLLGSINGALIAFTTVHPIIITFGTWNLFLFIGYRVFNSNTVNGIPNEFKVLGRGASGTTFGIPHAFAVTVVLFYIAWLILRHTTFGRSLYAIGGNREGARLAGINIRQRLFLVYAITGALTGFAALISIGSGTSSLDQSVGSGRELEVIAAVVIGGTSILGGRGSVLGTLLGAILVQTVISGVTQLGWPSQLSSLFVGLFIIIAVGADQLREYLRRRQ